MGSSWWPLLSLEVLALGGGGGGGGLMLEVELTTTVAGGGGGGPLFLPWLPRIWDCGDISTVSPRACPCGGRGHQPCSTLMALRTSACSSAALSLAVWATFVTRNPRYRGLHEDHVKDNTSSGLSVVVHFTRVARWYNTLKLLLKVHFYQSPSLTKTHSSL